MAFSNGSAQRSMATINITPLVDVMLVLLVIFMIAAPIATKVIPMTLPQTPIGPIPPQPKSEPIDLRVDASGEVFWNDNVTPLSALRDMMQAEVQRDPSNAPKLEIDASGDADYAVVAKVLAAAENAGLEQVRFVRN
ncbi:ExbD/TolR family protein [Luteimonas panaciterrae]|uniref:ExbD/TolR family protein n=1 Tax=Luteimonas panaciterrae TaxID=363885 RepID=UPI001CF9A8F0|nr:biopolymer transporter ExbD [Luteimonas panaciterrae]